MTLKHTKKIVAAVFAASLILAAVLSAGCIFGSQTTDILMGDMKVGTITITPVQEKFLSLDTPITEKFNAEIELFGVKYTKEGLTRTESDDLVALLSSGHPPLNLNDFVSAYSFKEPEGISNEDFFDKLIHMPMSAENDATFAEALDLSGVEDNIESAVQQIEKLLEGLS